MLVSLCLIRFEIYFSFFCQFVVSLILYSPYFIMFFFRVLFCKGECEGQLKQMRRLLHFMTKNCQAKLNLWRLNLLKRSSLIWTSPVEGLAPVLKVAFSHSCIFTVNLVYLVESIVWSSFEIVCSCIVEVVVFYLSTKVVFLLHSFPVVVIWFAEFLHDFV